MNKANFDDDDDDRTLVSSRRITKMKPGQMAKTAKQVAAVAKLGVP